MKQLFDKVASFIGLLILSPIFIVIIILIKINMPEPVFFIQKRIGLNGKAFKVIKFRTMSVNHNGSSISVRGENRITPFGIWLRKYKLDELPELFNVLKGDMSIVGPRPDVPGYADKLIGENRKILNLKPGITGLASLKYVDEEFILSKVNNPKEYNDNIIFPDKVKINLYYYYNHSFSGDIKIIFKTILSVINV